MTGKASLVWEYFECFSREGAEFSKCKINDCGYELSGCRATNAKRHLKAVHDMDIDALDKERHLANPTTTAALKAHLNDLRQMVGCTGVPEFYSFWKSKSNHLVLKSYSESFLSLRRTLTW